MEDAADDKPATGKPANQRESDVGVAMSSESGQQTVLPSEDRRKRHPLLANWRYAFIGRRRRVRREGDKFLPNNTLDYFGPGLFFAAIGIFCLSITDAWLTLLLIKTGVGEEANPIMLWLLELDVRWFVGAKILVTAFGIIALVVFSQMKLFGRLPITRIAYALCGSYAALIGYELVMLEAA